MHIIIRFKINTLLKLEVFTTLIFSPQKKSTLNVFDTLHCGRFKSLRQTFRYFKAKVNSSWDQEIKLNQTWVGHVYKVDELI